MESFSARNAMALLIDGYNLLHVSGIFGSGIGPRTLERARGALLNFLASTIEPEKIRQTVVVFDAKQSPPGLPGQVQHRGISVHFAKGYAEADELLEELIRADSSPRQLTVVSSDHRIQRAARRRRATAVDSDIWWNELSRRRSRDGQEGGSSLKPAAPLSEQEVQHWLDEFGDFEISDDSPQTDQQAAPPSQQQTPQPPPSPWKGDDLEAEDIGNPFPPGYGEDLFEENDIGGE